MKNMIIGLIPVVLVACAPKNADSLHDDVGDGKLLAPPSRGHGLQLRMTKTVASGNESYGCQFFQMPDEDLFVHEQSVQFSRGGHHVLLYKTPYDSIPERDENGSLVDAAEVHDCSEGVTARWKVDSVLGGSEIFDHPGMFRGLPERAAVRLPKKTVVVMSVHYLNASSRAMDVDARLNLVTIPRHDVDIEAGLLYLDNRFLYVPPLGTSIAEMHCPVPSDVFLANLQSHMHARGGFFSAAVHRKNEAFREVLYETQKWIEPPVETYDPYLFLHAGDRLETRCDYNNHEGREIGYGPNSSDEMCQLIGPYFPRDEAFEACANKAGELAATWVGHGLADGAATRSCLECATEVGGPEYVRCMFDACPAIAERVSEVVRCGVQRGAGACGVELAALSAAVCAD
jgi:Copper type II ascorbate-dependent monooxygenase, C-terminal domain